jgi:hypothetical protein
VVRSDGRSDSFGATVDASPGAHRRFASVAEQNEVMNWPQTTPASTIASALVKYA